MITNVIYIVSILFPVNIIDACFTHNIALFWTANRVRQTFSH
jgi:hypothetical protein